MEVGGRRVPGNIDSEWWKISRAAREDLERFVYAFAVVKLLRDRAWFAACFIEYILLSFAQIDATLRWAIVLKRQITNRNAAIPKDQVTARGLATEYERDTGQMRRPSAVAGLLRLIQNET